MSHPAEDLLIQPVEYSYDAFGLRAWLGMLSQNFGYKLLMTLFVVQHLLKGFTWTLSDMAVPYLYKAYQVPAPRVQIFKGVTQLPWAVKPILGVISDICPIGGLNKTPYMIITAIFGSAALLSIGIVPSHAIPVTGIVLCLLVYQMELSTCDLLSEAKYAEKIQLVPECGPDMLTYVWTGMSVASLIAVIISSFVLEAAGPQLMLGLCALPAALVFVPLAFGYLEEKVQSEEDVRQTRIRFYEQGETCFLCLVMLVSTIALTLVGILSEDSLLNCMFALGVGILVLGSFSLLLSPTIAKFNAFALLQSWLGFSISGATFYFYTDDPEQYKDGPHFTPFFYNSVLGTVGGVFSIVGLVTYKKCFSSWSYRSLLVMTNIVASLLSALDVMQFARVNLRIGIPDHAFVLGNSVMEAVIYQWQWMPQVVILSYMCPQGMEATMYALLAGCHNLGSNLSSICGALMLELLGCMPNGKAGESQQFDKLWIASAISAGLPLIAVLLLFRLIPDRKQDENLISENSATSGSLWRRWRGTSAN